MNNIEQDCQHMTYANLYVAGFLFLELHQYKARAIQMDQQTLPAHKEVATAHLDQQSEANCVASQPRVYYKFQGDKHRFCYVDTITASFPECRATRRWPCRLLWRRFRCLTTALSCGRRPIDLQLLKVQWRSRSGEWRLSSWTGQKHYQRNFVQA